MNLQGSTGPVTHCFIFHAYAFSHQSITVSAFLWQPPSPGNTSTDASWSVQTSNCAINLLTWLIHFLLSVPPLHRMGASIIDNEWTSHWTIRCGNPKSINNVNVAVRRSVKYTLDFSLPQFIPSWLHSIYLTSLFTFYIIYLFLYLFRICYIFILFF